MVKKKGQIRKDTSTEEIGKSKQTKIHTKTKTHTNVQFTSTKHANKTV